MNIYDFPLNSIIVRTESGKREQTIYNENLGIETVVTTFEDTSFMGEPVKLLDVQNGMIYIEKIGKSVLGMKKRNMPLHTFANGWEYFVVPYGYTMEDFEEMTIS